MRTSLAMVLVLLVACSRQVSPPVDGLPVPDDYRKLQKHDVGARKDAASTSSSTASRPASFTRAGVAFGVQPGRIKNCEGQGPVSAVVKWDVRRVHVVEVKVEVDDASSPARKLFAVGGASGEARTGDWVTAGVGFHLLDGKTGEVLALHRIEESPCD